MYRDLLPSFADELLKVAAGEPTSAELKVEAHHAMDVPKDWKAFEKNLKSPAFQKAVTRHPDSDSKLKRYVRNFGGHLLSTNTKGKELSRTKPKQYKIKQLPSGRLSCSCKDWQYHHSVRDTDCDHIAAFKSKMKTKISYMVNPSLFAVARGAGLSHRFYGQKEEAHKGRVTQEAVKKLKYGMPILPVSP